MSFYAGTIKVEVLYQTPAQLKRSKGILTVKVRSCKEMAAKDSNGLSDPYVVLALGAKKKRTKTKKKTLSPEFNETFQFKVDPELIKPTDSLSITVYDWDLGSRDDLIGVAYIPLESVETSGFSERNLMLRPPNFFAKGKTTSTFSQRDEVGLLTRLQTSSQLKISEDGLAPDTENTLTRAQTMVHLKNLAKEKYLKASKGAFLYAGEIHVGVEFNREDGDLTIQVNAAMYLDAADDMGLCDPFVEVRLGTQRDFTKVMKKTTDPLWNEVFHFKVNPDSTCKRLRFIVWDSRKGSQHLIGHSSLSLYELHEQYEAWLPLNANISSSKISIESADDEEARKATEAINRPYRLALLKSRHRHQVQLESNLLHRKSKSYFQSIHRISLLLFLILLLFVILSSLFHDL